MKAFRLAAAAVALAFVVGMQNEAQAEGWYVRVELRNKNTGQYKYPTLYSADGRADAYVEAAWYEMLMKLYPSKFQFDVLAPLGWDGNWIAQRVYVIYLPKLVPTGRP